MDADLQTLFRQAAVERGPFTAPWQAQAFSLTLTLHQDGHFTWSEWSECLGRELAASEGEGIEPGERYYLAWLRALEHLCRAKNLLRADELAARKNAWHEAARTTEHGKPIELDRDAD